MLIEQILQRYSSEFLIDLFRPLLTDERKRRIDDVLDRRIKTVHVALESPADIHNALAVTRSGEALGLYHFHLVDAQLVKGRGKATMRGSSRWIHLHKHQTVAAMRSQLPGFLLAGAASTGLQTLQDLPTDRPLCLLLGNERKGLSSQALAACDVTYRIPMRGMVESFNLSVAAALSLYEVLRNKRGDLTKTEKQKEKARFYIRSIGLSLASQLLSRKEEMDKLCNGKPNKSTPKKISQEMVILPH